MNKENIWVCTDCGLEDIEIKAWVRMNPPEQEPQWVEADNGSTDYWCEHCQDHTGAITLAEFEKQAEEEEEEL